MATVVHLYGFISVPSLCSVRNSVFKTGSDRFRLAGGSGTTGGDTHLQGDPEGPHPQEEEEERRLSRCARLGQLDFLCLCVCVSVGPAAEEPLRCRTGPPEPETATPKKTPECDL